MHELLAKFPIGHYRPGSGFGSCLFL